MSDEHAKECCIRCGDSDEVRPIYRTLFCKRCAVCTLVSGAWSHYGLTMEETLSMIEEANNNA